MKLGTFVQEVIWATKHVWVEERDIREVLEQIPPAERTPGNIYRAILGRRPEMSTNLAELHRRAGSVGGGHHGGSHEREV
jgi:hypothetical protein